MLSVAWYEEGGEAKNRRHSPTSLGPRCNAEWSQTKVILFGGVFAIGSNQRLQLAEGCRFRHGRLEQGGRELPTAPGWGCPVAVLVGGALCKWFEARVVKGGANHLYPPIDDRDDRRLVLRDA